MSCLALSSLVMSYLHPISCHFIEAVIGWHSKKKYCVKAHLRMGQQDSFKISEEKQQQKQQQQQQQQQLLLMATCNQAAADKKS